MKNLKYFKKSEFVKDPDKLHPDIMPLMDDLRHLAETPIYIHVAWNTASTNGHSKNSYHYKGMAVDFHFKQGILSPVEQFACIRSLPEFHGIGFYPWWNSPGWHVDIRQNPTLLCWISHGPATYCYGVETLLRYLLAHHPG